MTALAQALDNHLHRPWSDAFRPRRIVATHKAWLSPDLVVDIDTPAVNVPPYEPHAVVCWWEGGKAVVHTSTQAIFGTRAMISHAFRMPESDIRVISRFLGGGFGCKGQLWWPWMFWAMLASRKTGHPVRLELTRAQLFTLVGRRQETVQDLGLGFSADGRLTGIEHHVLAQTSTHAEYSDSTAVYSALPVCLPQCRDHAVSFVPTSRNPRCAPGALGTLGARIAFDKRPNSWGSIQSTCVRNCRRSGIGSPLEQQQPA